jgi:hypothetical protein
MEWYWNDSNYHRVLQLLVINLHHNGGWMNSPGLLNPRSRAPQSGEWRWYVRLSGENTRRPKSSLSRRFRAWREGGVAPELQYLLWISATKRCNQLYVAFSLAVDMPFASKCYGRNFCAQFLEIVVNLDWNFNFEALSKFQFTWKS